MDNWAIKVENLSKRYRIGLKEQTEEHLAKAVMSAIRSPLANYRKYRSLYDFRDVPDDPEQMVSTDDIIWALRGVSFEVPEGEVVGIIGRNGAGKSTLLKILSRITPPTTGRARIRGRISSLLEVGTGFHPELTGRENVYLNGTVLGMRKGEVDRKFDEIVAFAGVDKFLDTPVKRYSSGMRLRLAFAVAAHLEPEIMVIDEVLAVGDAAFQRKCMDKMQDVSSHGRTILFVSHNMPAITRLCSRAILLHDGRVVMDAPSHEVVNHYLNSGYGITNQREWAAADAPGDDTVRLRSLRVVNERGQTTDHTDVHKPVGIEISYEVLEDGHVLVPYLNVFNEEGIKVSTSPETSEEWRGRTRPPGNYVTTAWFPGNLLNAGSIYVGVAMRTANPDIRHFLVQDAVSFQVIDSLHADAVRGDFRGGMGGVIRPQLHWRTERLMEEEKALKEA